MVLEGQARCYTGGRARWPAYIDLVAELPELAGTTEADRVVAHWTPAEMATHEKPPDGEGVQQALPR